MLALLSAAEIGAAMQQRVLVIGGTGRIGTAAATHLTQAGVSVTLAGRSEERGRAAVAEVARDSGGAAPEFLCCDWTSASSLAAAVRGFDAVVHTAGPFSNSPPVVLEAAIAASVPAYVDLSDPVEYIDQALAMGPSCTETVALTAAGAFPGLSNILAMECASRLPAGAKVQDIDFQYFTAGLGGSGEVNLLITNEGFGEPVPVYQNGRYAPQMNAGGDERTVEFFLDSTDRSAELVGERAAWAWPFPEARTVARQLDIAGDSWVGMGTAPAIWNDVLGLFVKIVPRAWWRSQAFSNGLAKFSRPLVAATDLFVGETHAMRVDVTSTDGARVSAVQAHESFRRVVGQSCAEFTLALLDGAGPPGVYTPEALFADAAKRKPLLERLLALEGTLNWGFEGP